MGIASSSLPDFTGLAASNDIDFELQGYPYQSIFTRVGEASAIDSGNVLTMLQYGLKQRGIDICRPAQPRC